MTVPDQHIACYSEAVLKVSTPLKVNVISTLSGAAVMTIPFDRIRRFGCQIVVDRDIIWFETCSCRDEGEEYAFVVVASGIEKAYQVVLEYKRSMELALRDHMIMEEGDPSRYLYSFVVKSHYGHPEFPRGISEQMVSAGILNMSTSGGSLSLSDLNRITRTRPSMSIPTIGMSEPRSPVPGVMGASDTTTSPTHYGLRRSPSPHHSPSPSPAPPNPTTGKPRMSLDQFQPRLNSSSKDFDSGVGMDGLDPSRCSAPCYLGTSLNTSSSSWKDKKQRTTLSDIRKGHSFDEPFKQTPQPRKQSLAQLQKGGGIQSLQHTRKTSRGMDSAIGSSNDLPSSSGGSGSSRGGGGISLAAYDHLVKKVETISIQRSSPYVDRKTCNPAYVET